MSDSPTVAPYGTPLTEREMAVLMAVWETGGYSSAAQRLGISRNTVKNHLVNARSRLGVHTTLEAIRRVLA